MCSFIDLLQITCYTEAAVRNQRGVFCMSEEEVSLQDRIRQAGLRVTGPRLAVLTAVQGFGQHRDVVEIVDAARERLGTLSTQSVYDNLYALEEAGLVRRIQIPGQSARYEARVGDNHHHIVCRKCGATHDVDCAAGYAPCLNPVEGYGFVIDEAEVVYWGVCPDCQQATEQVS
jgi:Fur family transcriptional regulator, stress-responsive regulator